MKAIALLYAVFSNKTGKESRGISVRERCRPLIFLFGFYLVQLTARALELLEDKKHC